MRSVPRLVLAGKLVKPQGMGVTPAAWSGGPPGPPALLAEQAPRGAGHRLSEAARVLPTPQHAPRAHFPVNAHLSGCRNASRELAQLHGGKAAGCAEKMAKPGRSRAPGEGSRCRRPPSSCPPGLLSQDWPPRTFLSS